MDDKDSWAQRHGGMLWAAALLVGLGLLIALNMAC